MNLQTHLKPDLWRAVSDTYGAENYSHAVLDAMHHVSNVLREKAGVDADGGALVGQALGGKTPRLRVNKLQTESERNVQKGLAQILRGLYLGIRNPRSHEQIEDSKETADAIIYFVDYLLDILGRSEEPFTMPKFLARAFDVDFVESDRYARLLAAEIPAKKQTDAIIEIYRKKRDGDGEKVKYMVRAILELLSQDQVADFLDVASEELQTTSDDADVRMTLQILPPDLWPRVSEVARLRAENKLIRSIEHGKFDRFASECHEGALGTWARRFLRCFDLKREGRSALLAKLESTSALDRAYVARYFMGVLPGVCDGEWQRDRFVKAICSAVLGGDDYVKKRLTDHLWPNDWREAMRESLKDLEESDPDLWNSLQDDRIPEEEIPF